MRTRRLLSLRCAAWAVILGAPLFGQLNRATITGIITDSTGAVVPGVSVVARHTATGLTYNTVSNEVGNYTIGALPVGEYSVAYSAAGFKELVRQGLTLTAGQVVRVDVALEVGQVAEKLTVTGEAPLLQTETAHASKGVDTQVFNMLPLSFGGGRNMAEFASKLVAGVQGGSIHGTPNRSQSDVIDGMNSQTAFLPGNFAEQSISPEAIQELTVFTGNVSAEYGRASGGTLVFTLKSGTNDFHGSGFYYLRNEILNANDWNNNRLLAADPNFTNRNTESFKRPRERRFDKGFSAGGPVFFPKLYNGRDRTFFYFAYELFDRQETGPTTTIRSVPQPEMFDGNLSRLLTGTAVGTDVLGRQVREGQIYDPLTLREVNGQLVADPFLNNTIPASRISSTARVFKDIFAKYYPPVSSALTNNLYWTRNYKQNVKQGSLKVDHSLASAHKLSGFYRWHGFPRDFQDQGGLWSLADPTGGGPLARAQRQERRGYNYNANHDWLASPTVLNRFSFGVNVDGNIYKNRHAGKGYASQWNIKGVGLGLPEDKWTVPRFVLGGSPVVTFESFGDPNNRDASYRAYNFQDTLSWQRSKHTLKMGFEFSHMRSEEFRFDNTGGTFNFSARTTAIPGQPYSARIGHSFASFLLGLVDSASLTPIFNRAMKRNYAAAFVQDSWKVTRRLTLNLGLRWSGNSPIYEKEDRIANFSSLVRDPNAGNLPGAVEYMGSGAGRAGRRTPSPGAWRDLGPTFGLAYQMTNRLVMRAGYGITFTPEAIGWAMLNAYSAGFRPTNAVEADSKGLYRPVFQIDGGYPGQTQPPNLDPSYAQRYGGTMYPPEMAKAGYVQHFNFGFQAEVAKNLLLELEWRASKGTRLHSGDAVRPNQIRAEELSRGAVLGQAINSPARAAAAGLPYPYPGFSGTGAHTLLPFPQLTSRTLNAYWDTVGFSNYHSGNLIVTRRMSAGVYLYGAYTFSKTIANVTDVLGGSGGTTTGLQDTYNRRVYKSVSPDDRTHFLKSAMTWELPIGRGKRFLDGSNRFVNAVAGGWVVAALLNYSSGTPIGAPTSRTRPVGWNGPTVYANFNTPPGGFRRVFDTSKFNPWNANDPGNRFFDPRAFSDALPQQLGNSPVRFPQLRNLWRWSEDATLLKNFRVTERIALQIRLELLNAFNRHYFGGPEMNLNNSYFGNVWNASGARTGQFGMRVDW